MRSTIDFHLTEKCTYEQEIVSVHTSIFHRLIKYKIESNFHFYVDLLEAFSYT